MNSGFSDWNQLAGNSQPKSVLTRAPLGEEVEGRARLLEHRPEHGGADEQHEDHRELPALGGRPAAREEEPGEAGRPPWRGAARRRPGRRRQAVSAQRARRGEARDRRRSRASTASTPTRELPPAARGLLRPRRRDGREPGVAEVSPARQVLEQPEGHSHGGHREAEVPGALGRDARGAQDLLEARALRQPSAGEGREEGAEVDPHVVEREAGVAPRVVGRVELAHHRADVRLQEPGAEDHEREAEIEGRRGSERRGRRARSRMRTPPRASPGAGRGSGRRASRPAARACRRAPCRCRRSTPASAVSKPRPPAAAGAVMNRIRIARMP